MAAKYSTHTESPCDVTWKYYQVGNYNLAEALCGETASEEHAASTKRHKNERENENKIKNLQETFCLTNFKQCAIQTTQGIDRWETVEGGSS